MEKYIITIGREFGSMGRPIGLKLAEALGIDYYDRDIVEETAKKMNLPVSTVSDQEELGNRYISMIFPLGVETEKRKNEIFQNQRRIITTLAAKDSCIIVGRCSDYILQNEPNILNIYIRAPYEKRIENCIKYFDMTEAKAKKMIGDVDKARERYHWQYAGYAPTDNKDIILNSAYFGIDGSVKVLEAMVRAHFNLDKKKTLKRGAYI